MREIKFQMLLRALKDTKSGHKKGDKVKMTNSIFDRDNGVAFFEIGLDWEIVWQRQFTGLLDKNGVEIYDGDILKEDGSGIFEVAWDSEWAKFFLDHKRTSPSIQYPGWNRGIKMEVIGNIHQSPELIKGNGLKP